MKAKKYIENDEMWRVKQNLNAVYRQPLSLGLYHRLTNSLLRPMDTILCDNIVFPLLDCIVANKRVRREK